MTTTTYSALALVFLYHKFLKFLLAVDMAQWNIFWIFLGERNQQIQPEQSVYILGMSNSVLQEPRMRLPGED